MTRIHRVQIAMSDWQFWVCIAYVGLVLVVVALYFVNGRTTKAAQIAAREAAVRQASVVSDHKAQKAARVLKVDQCLDSRKPGSQLIRINRFLHGVQEFHRIVAANNKAIVDATPKSDPQYQVRLANYRRILGTVNDVAGVKFPVPTVAQCKALGNP